REAAAPGQTGTRQRLGPPRALAACADEGGAVLAHRRQDQGLTKARVHGRTLLLVAPDQRVLSPLAMGRRAAGFSGEECDPCPVFSASGPYYVVTIIISILATWTRRLFK